MNTMTAIKKISLYRIDRFIAGLIDELSPASRSGTRTICWKYLMFLSSLLCVRLDTNEIAFLEYKCFY